MNIENECNDLRAREEPFVLATVVAYKSPQSAKPGSKAIIKLDGSMTGWIGGGCVQPIVLREGHSPVAETLAQLGTLLDFKVVAADSDFSSVTDQINESSYVVVATMGNCDEEGLLAVLGTRPRYLGLVASQKKAQALFDYALSTGATKEDIDAIRCPAGIEIGGETLPEIALSVAAEIVRVRRSSDETAPEMKETAVDPICGMTVDIDNARYTSVANGETIYFCCLRRKETYDQPRISQITRI